VEASGLLGTLSVTVGKWPAFEKSYDLFGEYKDRCILQLLKLSEVFKEPLKSKIEALSVLLDGDPAQDVTSSAYPEQTSPEDPLAMVAAKPGTRWVLKLLKYAMYLGLSMILSLHEASYWTWLLGFFGLWLGLEFLKPPRARLWHTN
jgi:hypothetical protein